MESRQAVATEPSPEPGEAHRRVQVFEAPDTLTVVVPRRRTKRTNVIGVVAMIPFGYYALRVGIVTGFMASGSDSLLEFLELVPILLFSTLIGLFVNFYSVLGVLVGAYMFWGSTRVDVSREKVVVKRALGKASAYFGGVDLSSPEPEVAVAVDKQGRSFVQVLPVAGHASVNQRKAVFGAGDLSESQAVELAEVLSAFLRRLLGESSAPTHI